MTTKRRKSTDTMRLETPKANAEKKQKVKFHMRAPVGSKVFVAGTFNNWDPSANKMRRNGDETCVANIALSPGRHEYKFVVDGEWRIDTNNPVWASNNLGSLNSIVEV